MVSRQMKENFYRLTGPLLWANGLIYKRFRAPTTGIVRVQLGPGKEKYLHGWVNVDANPVPSKRDVWADLRNPLPFRDGTVDAFYSHHVIEHLPDAQLAGHFREMFRCLKPGGAIRVGGPNGEAACQKFAVGDANWFDGYDFPDRHESLGGRLANFIFCRGEHLTILSYSYLKELATNAGFEDVRQRTPKTDTGYPHLFDAPLATEWETSPETPHTLLIETRKPEGSATGEGLPASS